MVTPTKIGRLHKLKQTYGLTTMPADWIGLDGSSASESSSQEAPAQELTTGGCGRVKATVTDVSAGNVTALKLTVNYEFSAANTINAVFGAWSATPGNNMTWRHKLTSPQNVGPEDTMTFELTDTEGVVV